MLHSATDYETLTRTFAWEIPENFNIANAACERWAAAEPDRIAIVHVHADGRSDRAGYRIGPGEVEDCLGGHPAVKLAAVVGKPDALRTEIVKAFIVLKPGFEASDTLAGEIRSYVRIRLAAHEYPREIAFIDELPLTTTGKVIRRLLR